MITHDKNTVESKCVHGLLPSHVHLDMCRVLLSRFTKIPAGTPEAVWQRSRAFKPGGKQNREITRVHMYRKAYITLVGYSGTHGFQNDPISIVMCDADSIDEFDLHMEGIHDLTHCQLPRSSMMIIRDHQC